MKKLLLNLIFYPSFVLVTVLIPAISLLPMVLFRLTLGSRKTLYILRTLIRYYGCIVVRILPFPFVRVEYRDFERDKTRGACVFVCNHRSSSDAFLMGCLQRELVQVVNNWPFKIPVIGLIGRLAGYLSVRTMPFEEFQRTSCKLLREGVSVVAFPEGSRSRDKTLHQFNGTVFRVAQMAGVPIIPICLSGNQDIPPKGSGILNPGTIKIHKLPALEWESFKDLTPFAVKNKVRAVLQEELDRLEPRPVDQENNENPWLEPVNDGRGQVGDLPVKASAYIPHCREMCVIDDLIEVGKGSAQAEVTVRGDSPFVRLDGSVEECLFVEMIAQTIAAAAGFELPLAERKTLEGYLLGVRALKISCSARVGDVLRIKASKSAEFGDFSMIEGSVSRGTQVLAQGEIKVFQRSTKETGTRYA